MGRLVSLDDDGGEAVERFVVAVAKELVADVLEVGRVFADPGQSTGGSARVVASQRDIRLPADLREGPQVEPEAFGHVHPGDQPVEVGAAELGVEGATELDELPAEELSQLDGSQERGGGFVAHVVVEQILMYSIALLGHVTGGPQGDGPVTFLARPWGQLGLEVANQRDRLAADQRQHHAGAGRRRQLLVGLT